MGFLKRFHQGQKKEQKETEQKVEEFKKKVGELGREYGMTIIPVITRYGLELEIQVLSKEDLDKKEIKEGNVGNLSRKI